jgi:hypothetical protein
LKIDCLGVKHPCSDFLVTRGCENLDKVSNALPTIFCQKLVADDGSSAP